MRKELVDSVTRLGLTNTQSRVYIAILEIGDTNVGPIVSKTGLHRQQVYNSLADLVGMGLVAESLKSGRKYFRAAPDALVGMQRSKLELARNLLPELKRLSGDNEQLLQARVLQGRRGFFENLCMVVDYCAKSDGVMRFLGGAKPPLFYQTLGEYTEAYLDYVVKRRISKQGIISTEYSDQQLQNFLELDSRNRIRIVPMQIESPTFTRITEGLVTIEVFEPELTVFQLKNTTVASAYREYFDIIWKTGKEVARKVKKTRSNEVFCRKLLRS